MSRSFALTVLALVASLGCGGSSDELIPVSGTVKFADGSPASFESGRVVFEPVAGGPSASGSVEQDGTFAMMTATPGDGVKPGQYKVVVQLWTNYRDQKLAVPDKYGDASTTPLEATVDEDHTHFDLTVEK
jgi:hypothetical protein